MYLGLNKIIDFLKRKKIYLRLKLIFLGNKTPKKHQSVKRKLAYFISKSLKRITIFKGI